MMAVIFHEKLQRRVRELNLNMSKAAEAANLPKSTISSFLSRPDSLPRCDIALGIARALNVPVEWLVDDSQEWPPPSMDVQDLRAISDHDLMTEACRRLMDQAKKLSVDLDRIEKEDWHRTAIKLVSIPSVEPLPDDYESTRKLIHIIEHAIMDFRQFDASYGVKDRYPSPPDREDFEDRVQRIRNLKGVEQIRAYLSLRHLADYMKRHGIPASERNLEADRLKLLNSLEPLPKKPKP